jgi:hypothetical protein
MFTARRDSALGRRKDVPSVCCLRRRCKCVRCHGRAAHRARRNPARSTWRIRYCESPPRKGPLNGAQPHGTVSAAVKLYRGWPVFQIRERDNAAITGTRMSSTKSPCTMLLMTRWYTAPARRLSTGAITIRPLPYLPDFYADPNSWGGLIAAVAKDSAMPETRPC